MTILVLYRKSEGGHSRTITQGWYTAEAAKDAYDFITSKIDSWESYVVYDGEQVILDPVITLRKVGQ